MSLPRFIERAADAALPLLSEVDRETFVSRLEVVVPALRIDQADSRAPGLLLAVNLAARLYPRLVIEAPQALLDECRSLAKAINPKVEFGGEATHRLAFAKIPSPDATVTVFACGWNVSVDGGGNPLGAVAAAPAALAAGAIGSGELFRAVFADQLPRGRHEREPGSFNLVSLTTWDDVPLPRAFKLGRVHLAGAGAIGQATLLTLAASGVHGEFVVVDPQRLELSNLQRYVLSYDKDIDKRKVDIAARVASKKLRTRRVASVWGGTSWSRPGRDVVLVGLDSARARIGVQAGLHRRIYNAYTQPSDLGWSRHEGFGSAPCLACLYWPTAKRPHRYQSIAHSLDQPELRIRAYLASRLPVGSALPSPLQLPVVEAAPTSEEIHQWQTTPLIHDLAPRYGLDDEVASVWSSRSLDELYREAICGGAFVRTDRGSDVLVPLAHQSVFAGIMLAVQAIVASNAGLRAHRTSQTEGRLDMLRRLPARFELPTTERVPSCICCDDDFVKAFSKLVQRQSRNSN